MPWAEVSCPKWLCLADNKQASKEDEEGIRVSAHLQDGDWALKEEKEEEEGSLTYLLTYFILTWTSNQT